MAKAFCSSTISSIRAAQSLSRTRGSFSLGYRLPPRETDPRRRAGGRRTQGGLIRLHRSGRNVLASATNAEGDEAFPEFAARQLVPESYLRQVEQLKSTVTIPVIASLNDPHPGGWLECARRLEDAGADGIELPRPTAGPTPPLSSHTSPPHPPTADPPPYSSGARCRPGNFHR